MTLAPPIPRRREEGGEATQDLKTVAREAAGCAHQPRPQAHRGCQTESGPGLTLRPLPSLSRPLTAPGAMIPSRLRSAAALRT